MTIKRCQQAVEYFKSGLLAIKLGDVRLRTVLILQAMNAIKE